MGIQKEEREREQITLKMFFKAIEKIIFCLLKNTHITYLNTFYMYLMNLQHLDDNAFPKNHMLFNKTPVPSIESLSLHSCLEESEGFLKLYSCY